MDRYSDVIQNESGRAVAGATVLILDETGQQATIYADRAGTPTANPIMVDALGRWSFCAVDGLYTARAYLSGVLKAELRDIRLEGTDESALVLAELLVTVENLGTSKAPQSEVDALEVSLGELGDAVVALATSKADQSGVATLEGRVTDLEEAPGYALPTATASTLGGIKVGTGLAVDGNGLLSATGLAEGVVSTVNNVAPTSGNVTLTTSELTEGSNLYHTAARVRAVTLTGLSTATNAVITAADTVLGAFGKLQKQITDHLAAKDATGGYVGLTAFKINFKNTANTFTSFFANANTAARTYTFPDKDGTVAMTSDLPVLPLTLYVQTADQAITFNGALTIAHGMAVEPKIVSAFLKCKTAANGYSVGDVFPYPIGFGGGGAAGQTATVTFDATNLYVRFSGGFSVLDKATGIGTQASASNYSFLIRAVA